MIKLKQCLCGGNGGDIIVEVSFIRPQGIAAMKCKFCEKVIRVPTNNLNDLAEEWNEVNN